MLHEKAVLLLASRDDGEAHLVASALHARGVAAVRLDTADFPRALAVQGELGLHGWTGSIDTPGGLLDLDDVAAVFYRQPQPFGFPEGMNAAELRFARVEARFGLGGLLASLPVDWVPGPPGRVADAEYKPVQLATAARAGLTVPATLLTNVAERARRFADHPAGGVVYKALMRKLVTDQGEPRMIYTTPVTGDDIDERVGATMHQFQVNLAAEKTCDVRIVATRSRALGVAIHTSDGEARQDFRSNYDALTYQQVDVPQRVARGCRNYLEALQLRMGVFDFCCTRDGWYFLECGPGAQWAWLEEASGAPLAVAVAEEVSPW